MGRPPKTAEVPVIPLTVTSHFTVFIALIIAENIPFVYFICWGILFTWVGAL